MDAIADKKSILDKAKLLEPVDRLQLVNALLESLDTPNPEIEKMWAREADVRYDAYKRGKLKATDWEDIKGKYE